MLTAAALLGENRLVLSSPALAAPVIGLAWAVDAGWRVVTGAHLFGGSEYMWDPQNPLFTRLLSLCHLAWPVLVVVLVRRVGYDKRGWALQSGIAAGRLSGGGDPTVRHRLLPILGLLALASLACASRQATPAEVQAAYADLVASLDPAAPGFAVLRLEVFARRNAKLRHRGGGGAHRRGVAAATAARVSPRAGPGATRSVRPGRDDPEGSRARA